MTVNSKTGGMVTLDGRYIFVMYGDGKGTYVFCIEGFGLGMGQEKIYIKVYIKLKCIYYK